MQKAPLKRLQTQKERKMLTVEPSVLAKEVLRRIEENPETHDQTWWVRDSKERTYYAADGPAVRRILLSDPDSWECGTTACIAGHAVSAALTLEPNREFLLEALSYDWIEEIASELFECMHSHDIFMIDGPVEEANKLAVEWLKLIAAGETADWATYLVLYADDPDIDPDDFR